MNALSFLEINTGRLAGNGDVITATVRLLTRPNAPVGASLGERMTYTSFDARGNNTRRSNQPVLVVADRESNSPFYPLTATPNSGQAGSTHTFGANIFHPGERVSFWYNAPGGGVVGVAVATADNDGAVAVQLTTTGLAAGNYSMVAQGDWTRFIAVGPFTVR